MFLVVKFSIVFNERVYVMNSLRNEEYIWILLKPFSPSDQNNFFANNVDPDEQK